MAMARGWWCGSGHCDACDVSLLYEVVTHLNVMWQEDVDKCMASQCRLTVTWGSQKSPIRKDITDGKMSLTHLNGISIISRELFQGICSALKDFIKFIFPDQLKSSDGHWYLLLYLCWRSSKGKKRKQKSPGKIKFEHPPGSAAVQWLGFDK